MFSSDEKLRPRGYPKFFDPILKDTEENMVMLYTKNNCSESKTMRDRLKNEKISFVEKNIDSLSKENPQAAKDYALGLRVIAQKQSMPQLFVCGDLIGDIADLQKAQPNLKELVKQCFEKKKKRTSQDS